jgi:hypothetical protein
MIVRRALVAIICVTISLTGCTTMKPVDLPADKPISAVLQPNDFVRIWMRDGRVIEARLTAVEPDALVSGQQRLQIKDIERVERLGFSAGRTALLVLGICATFVAGVAIWFSTHPAPI